MEVLQNNYNQLSYAHQRNIEIANNKMRELGERVKSLASTERELRQQADKSREEMKKMELKLFQTQVCFAARCLYGSGYLMYFFRRRAKGGGTQAI